MKKDFTIVYEETFYMNSKTQHRTKIARYRAFSVQDVKELEEYEGRIKFIFEGHPKLQGEESLGDFTEIIEI